MRRIVIGFVVFCALVVLAGCGGSESTTTTARETTTTAAEIDKTKFTDAWRSLMAIEGATTVGVKYADLQALVQDFATELALLPQELTRDESLVASKLADTCLAYDDSLYLWELEIKFAKYDAYDGGLIPYVAENQHMVSKYGLSFVPGDSKKLQANSIQRVWSYASGLTDELRPSVAP